MKKSIFAILFLVLWAAPAASVFAGPFDDAVSGKVNQLLPEASVRVNEEGQQAGRQALPSANLKTQILPKAIKTFLMLVGSLSLVVFVYAGVMLVIAQGNEEDVTKFKNILLWSLVGLAFITASYAIVRGIMGISFT